MRIAICDDEKLYRDETAKFLREIIGEELSELKSYSSGEEFLSSPDKYDFLFLDIEMPGQDGIAVKNILERKRSSVRIVFLTSHEERMIEAFGENVIGFLKKPIRREELSCLLEKIMRFYRRKKVEWESDKQHYVIYADAVRYVQAQNIYTHLVTDSGQYLVRRTLKEWEQLLSTDEFCKVNRSYLVNMKLFDRRKDEIVLEQGESIKLSRKNKLAIEEKYILYLRKKAGEL